MVFPAARSRYWFLLFLLTGCLLLSTEAAAPLSANQNPHAGDDLHYRGLREAISQSLIYLDQRPEKTELNLLGKKIAKKHLIRSLLFFRSLLRSNPSPKLLSLEIKTYFDLYKATAPGQADNQDNVLVTGYYQPVFAGSLVKKEPYLYPLYGIPDNIVLRRNQDNIMEIGRLQGGKFLPYWSRRAIEQHGHGKGFELVYLKDPFDAFLLHIQGSGLIRLRDGCLRSIHYAMKNGRAYRSIGKFMIQTGRIKKENMGLAAIRQYLASHPEEREEILQHNPSFIFFRWSESSKAIGNLGRPLTAHRSIAVDQRLYPAGGLALLTSNKPVPDTEAIRFIAFSRFVLAQDTGSAIRGPGRVDLFWGTGPDAGRAAGRMKEKGELYFLLLKKKFL
jgi:membrane-bound lytic murein transglycosylase A